MKPPPFFPEIAALTPADTVDTPAKLLPPAPLLDGRQDFNVVFIHSRLDDYGLTPPQFRVYAHIARRASSGAAWPAVTNIARICKLHPQTVRRALHVLVQHRLITRESRPGTTPIYRLTPASQWQPSLNINGNPSESNPPASVLESTPPKRIEGNPTEKDRDEGNPSEGDPVKERIQIPCIPDIPCNEKEAVKQAELVGVPPEFARTEFLRLESTDWVNGAGNPVRKWLPHLRKRWADDQSQRAERKIRAAVRPGRHGGFVPPRTFESVNYQQSVEDF
jgi:DNA-binding transcriptional ArsR family regulator